jgi:hypothetical protein
MHSGSYIVLALAHSSPAQIKAFDDPGFAEKISRECLEALGAPAEISHLYEGPGWYSTSVSDMFAQIAQPFQDARGLQPATDTRLRCVNILRWLGISPYLAVIVKDRESVEPTRVAQAAIQGQGRL